MSEYKSIKGFKVQTVSADPPTFELGQVFYNSTGNAFKVTRQGITIGSWSSGANMNNARSEFSTSKSDTDKQATVSGGSNAETYDSISWTTITASPTTSGAAAGFGTKDDFTKAGGIYSTPPGYNVTVNWNGSSWTTGGNMNLGRYDIAAFGLTGSSGLCGGGTNPVGPAGGDSAQTESYNGTSWTILSSMNTASRTYDGAGVQTAGISATRGEMSPNAYCEIWNGSTWTESTDLNSPRQRASMSGLSSTSVLCFGGYTTANVAINEYWNGTTWTELNDLATARNSGKGSGNSSSSLMIGGSTTTPVATTEEWNITANSIITVS